jgi:lipid II:glycine glycyltransferase (peptidoglycan interpeptide bridge formation enzyme)
LYLDNEVISLLGVYIYNGVWTEINSSTKKIAFQKGIPASHILHDYIIKEAYSENAIMFDLAGLNGENKDSKKRNIDIFKLKFTRDIKESRRIKLYYPFY